MSNSGIDFIVWDADGVILDSRATAWAVAREILMLFRIDSTIASCQDYERYFGRHAQEALIGVEGAETLRALHRILMRQRANEVGLFDSVVTIIKMLTVPSRIVTSAYAEGISKALGPASRVFTRIDGRETGRKANLLSEMADNSRFLYVTDSPRDVSICQSLACEVIGVTWGYHERHLLKTSQPTYLVDTPAQLQRVLQSILEDGG